jgi:fatty acid desaturase
MQATEASAVEQSGQARKGRQIRWYRTPIDKELLKSLSTRSDFLGAVQTLGYLGIYGTTGTLSVLGWWWWPWWAVLPVVFLHGMVTAFMINGVHELGHGTVFRTKQLNSLFCHVLAFLGWINHRMFAASHSRHHAYTLHPPDDLEVVLPIRYAVSHFFRYGFVNPWGIHHTVKDTWRIARGRMRGAWELTLFPEGEPEKRRGPMAWAWQLLIGHGVIVVASATLAWATGAWVWLMVPVVTTLAPFYGGWLFFLCNNTQHVGLMDNVPDFRLCCRTFTLNPFVRVLYWQMNYHTEHHMYPTVPCYHLARLHRAIRADLPPCPAGLVATWREIIAILRKQKDDPRYQHVAIIPVRPAPTGGF